MKTQSFLPKLPKFVRVSVEKGESGVLVAELPELNAVTEANNLSELFIIVNDLIYTYFDIPKKYQNQVMFVPSKEAVENLLLIESAKQNSAQSQFKIKTYFTEEYFKSMIA